MSDNMQFLRMGVRPHSNFVREVVASERSLSNQFM